MSTSLKPVILFVDDEPSILQGLRRNLRSQRDRWSVEFCEGGRDAIERIHKGRVDVVVTDMRMPGVDGVQVLHEAAKTHPETIRFILSGYAERDALLKALGPAHRFLSKPCDTDLLIAAINDALALRQMLPVETLRALVSSLKSIPVPSETYFQLLTELDSPTSSAKSVAKAVERDTGLSTQLLRLANSAYFGIPKRITSVTQALEMLGIETVRALLTVSEFYLIDAGNPELAKEARSLADRSLQIGALARNISTKLGLTKAEIDNCVTASLLSHIGTAVLMFGATSDFEKAQSLADSGKAKTISEAEREVFGATHAELAAYMVGLWGFPDSVCKAIAFHHTPDEAPKTSQSKPVEEDQKVLGVVHLAQAITAQETSELAGLFHQDSHQPELDKAFLQKLGLASFILERPD